MLNKKIKILVKTLKELEKQNSSLKRKLSSLKKDMIHDSLTGLKTRSFLEEELQRNLNLIFIKDHKERREKFGFTKISILFIDLDNFKKINDKYGHAVGDDVLKSVSKVLTKHVRSTDVVARYGGEEMAITLLGDNERQAYYKAEKIRESIKNLTFRNHYSGLKITVSIGVAQAKELSLTKLLKEADVAMYKAKQAGKNMAVRYSDVLKNNVPTRRNLIWGVFNKLNER